MYVATTRGGALRAVGSRAPAATPRARLRAGLLRHWREAQRCAALNIPAGTVKRGRA
ncbi:hypothetical protein ACFXN2_16135 [Streptomyces kronopolitis]|uniref:Uncharacterized protein n=1 Tax=Streptomyces kronopolitis TaxID=1612435 RepID=A0ABQ2K063_9ACTN|nr:MULTISPECIES: hypothetical protein [Streptomyces]MCL6297481.1 hypothetical protein [Streptomyces kronopolitis]GGN60863.1 hypothetical protein GCM10012285_59340 [Streptomyces kronopolitis]GLW16417.1 hypothetical protein Stsp01_31600 [Streptomyces sp. NBRC 13847]